MDDESLEEQMNQARRNLPARIPEIFGQGDQQEQPGPELRTATAEPLVDNQRSDKDRSSNRNSSVSDPRQGYALSSQVKKVGEAVRGAALAANSLGVENHDSLAAEMNKEAGEVALLGAAGIVRGLKAGLTANKEEAQASSELLPSSREAIDAFIAKLPPPPKAIAPPLRRLPAPGRVTGPERD